MKYLGNPSSGSLANQTFSRNRFGQYIRRRAIPVQPRTAAQQRVRSFFGAAAKEWAQLPITDQEQWIAWADTKTFYDQLGQPYKKTGMQAFIGAKVLNLLTNIIQSPLLPPADWTPPVGNIESISTEGQISFNPPATGDKIFLYASAPASFGTNFFGNLKLIKMISSTETSPIDITPQYENIYGAWPTRKKICFRARYCKAGSDLGPAEQYLLRVVP